MTNNVLVENASYSSMEVLLHTKSTGGKLPKSRMPAKPRARIQKAKRCNPHVKSKPLTEVEMELYNYLSTLPDLESNMISTPAANSVNEDHNESTEIEYFNSEEPCNVIYNSSIILYDYSYMMEEYNLENTTYISPQNLDENYSDEDMEELWNIYEKFCWMCD
jgi:hypothetical protein